jgi:hypothetical protein
MSDILAAAPDSATSWWRFLSTKNKTSWRCCCQLSKFVQCTSDWRSAFSGSCSTNQTILQKTLIYGKLFLKSSAVLACLDAVLVEAVSRKVCMLVPMAVQVPTAERRISDTGSNRLCLCTFMWTRKHCMVNTRWLLSRRFVYENSRRILTNNFN